MTRQRTRRGDRARTAGRRRWMMVLAVAMAGGMTGCASLVSNSAYPVYLDSNVAGAEYVVRNQHGLEVKRGATPSIAVLESGAGYFERANYTVEFMAPGYLALSYPLRSRLNGWYWGNFITLPGFLIDSATGAMWRLPQRLTVQLPEEPVYLLPVE